MNKLAHEESMTPARAGQADEKPSNSEGASANQSNLEFKRKNTPAEDGVGSKTRQKDAPLLNIKKDGSIGDDIVIGKSNHVYGQLVAARTIFVEGVVSEANVVCDRLVVSEGGRLEGDVDCNSSEIAGIYAGRLVASSEVVVRSSAEVHGKVSCGTLVAHRGALVACDFVVAGSRGALSGGEGRSDRSARARRKSSGRWRRASHVLSGVVLTLLGTATAVLFLMIVLLLPLFGI